MSLNAQEELWDKRQANKPGLPVPQHPICGHFTMYQPTQTQTQARTAPILILNCLNLNLNPTP